MHPALIDRVVVRARARLGAVLWLVATVLLVGPVRVAGPGVGLDPGWASGLSLAHQAGMRFGRELSFSYGPWGFLDAPVAISRPDFALGLSFSVASVVATWLLTVAILRSQMSPRMALLAASVLTLTLSSLSSPSFLLAAVGTVACVCHLRQLRTLDAAWCLFAVSGLAALLLQIKFSEGAVVTAFALATSLTSPRSRLLRTVGSVLVWVATFLVLWAAAGQSMSDLRPWWHASTDIVLGYSGAMSLDLVANAVSIVWLAMALLLIVSVLVLGWRRRDGLSGLSRVGAASVTAGALLFGFKQSFTRHDLQHNAAFFVIAALFLCTMLDRGPTRRATAALVALACLLASPAAFSQVRANPVDAWALTWRTFTSDASWSATVKHAREDALAAYSLPTAMVAATSGHAVSVDPWEVSMVWAYSMRWRPVPVFQSYSAYTAYLDQANADAAGGAGDDQMVIRATTVSTRDRQTSIDGRNPMWESPRYTLALVCNYRTVIADKRWMLLRKSVNRCGVPSPPTAIRAVTAGERIEVPRADPDQIVTASFFPRQPTVLKSLVGALFKDTGPLGVALNGQFFRLPKGLASGPLLTVLPAISGWPAEFRGDLPARSITFSRPGTLQFRRIDLVRQESEP